MKIKLVGLKRGGIELWLKSIMTEKNLKFPLEMNGEIDNSMGHPIIRIKQDPFNGCAAGNFKYDIVQ